MKTLPVKTRIFTLVLLVFAASLQFASEKVALAAEPMCPAGVNADPDVMLCEDFEDGTWLDDWAASPFCCDTDLDGLVSALETEGVTCGSRGFRDNCAAWTEEGQYWGFDGSGYGQHYAEKLFSTIGVGELYVRWYVYVSDPFLWSEVGNKSLRVHDGLALVQPYVVANMWGTAQPHIILENNIQTPCVNQSTPNEHGEYPRCVVRPQNMGNDITLEAGKWYLFEWYVKLNDPGVPNGTTKLWVDDASAPVATQTLRASYTDVVFRTELQAELLLRAVWLSAYHNANEPLPTQHMKWDNIVISRAPIGPVAGFGDDFETAVVSAHGSIGGWDGPANPSTMYLAEEQAHSGRRALQLEYAPGSTGASYMYRHFTGLNQAYHRWYQRWSPGFIWDSVGTALGTLGPAVGWPRFWSLVLWGSGELAIHGQVIAEAAWDARNFYQNQGTPVVFQPDRWYCIEVFVKLNTPGAADGELAAWIDGELKLLHSGRRFRGADAGDPAPPAAMVETAMVSGYYGGPVPQLQFSWQDDHVASTRRIGCQDPLSQ